MGLLQTQHVIWDQRTEGAEASENLQDYQVSGTKKAAFTKNNVLLQKCAAAVVLFLLFVLQFLERQSVISFCQILGLSQEPGCVPHELHEVHHQPAFSSLSLHCRVCPAGDAAFWRKVNKASQIRHPFHLPVVVVALIFCLTLVMKMQLCSVSQAALCFSGIYDKEERK